MAVPKLAAKCREPFPAALTTCRCCFLQTTSTCEEAWISGLVARRLRQPLIIGYVFGGIFIGPFTPGPAVSEVHILELFADVGVLLLMYSVGIEFSLKDLLAVKWDL